MKCLLFKLPVAVTNDNLPVIELEKDYITIKGVLTADNGSASIFAIRLISGIKAKAEIISDGVVFSLSTQAKEKEFTGKGDDDVYFSLYGAKGQEFEMRLYGKESVIFITNPLGYNINDLSKSVACTQINQIGAIYSEGNIEKLGKLLSLSSIDLGKTNISGDFGKLANAMFANGRKSGTLTLHLHSAYNGNITYNGAKLPTDYTITATFTDTGVSVSVV